MCTYHLYIFRDCWLSTALLICHYRSILMANMTFPFLLTILTIWATFSHAFSPNESSLIPAERQSSSDLCYEQCQFKFCDDSTEIIMGVPFAPSPQTICRKDRSPIGKIIMGDRNYIFRDNRKIRMIDFNPPVLNRPMQRGFIYYDSQFDGRGSAIGVNGNSGNRMQTIDGECVITPVRKYQLRIRPNRFRTISTNRPTECVAFRVLYTDVSFELFWDNFDELFLEVFEPSGTRVSAQFPSSACGKFIRHGRYTTCNDNQRFVGHHRIIFQSRCPKFQEGTYRVRVMVGRRCRTRNVWEVKASVSGNRIFSSRGIIPQSSIRSNRPITEFNIRIPPS